MPNTLDLLAEKGDDLQPLLRLLPALLPLAGQPADRPLRPQQRRQGQRAAQRRLLRLLLPRRLQPQPRHLAAGRRLPHDPHRQVPQRLRRRTVRQRNHRAARLELLAHRAQRRHPPLLLRLHAQQQRPAQRTLRRLGELGNARIHRSATPPAAPSRRRRAALHLRDRHLQLDGAGRNAGHAGRTALLPAARLHRPARRLPPPGRARAGAAPLRLVQGREAAARPLGRLRRGQRHRQAALHPRSRTPDPERHAHLQGLLREAARVAALGRRRRQRDRRHARASCTGCATPTSSSPPTTASSSASTA